MKKLFLFLLIYNLSIKVLCQRSLVSSAISEIIRDFYIPRKERFDIIIYGSEKEKLNDIATSILIKISDSAPRRLIEPVGGDILKIDQSAIFLFDSLNSFNNLRPRIQLINRFYKRFNFLIYICDLKESDFSRFYLQRHYHQFESFLVLKDNLLTIKKFQCYKPNPKDWVTIEINNYSVQKRKWKNRDYFPETIKDYKGEQFSIEVVPDYPLAIITFDSKREFVISGYGVDMFREMAKKFNIKLYLNPFDTKSREVYNKNITTNGHILSRNLRINLLLRIRVFFTQPYKMEETCFLISRNKPYTQYDKMLLPFDTETWIALIILFTSAVFVIAALRFAPKYIRNFIIGFRVETPMINLM